MDWITPKRGGRQVGQRKEFSFRVGNHSGGAKGTMQAVIAISESTMKDLRWVIGDKIIIGHEKGMVHLKRVTKNGFALSPSGGKLYKDVVGKMASAVVKTSSFKFPEDAPIYIDEYIVENDVIVFSYK